VWKVAGSTLDVTADALGSQGCLMSLAATLGECGSFGSLNTAPRRWGSCDNMAMSLGGQEHGGYSRHIGFFREHGHGSKEVRLF
jgi:hypothetical protein